MRIQELHDRLIEAARQAKFQVEYYGQAGDYSLPAFTYRTESPRAHFYVSAGVHGDEPAGPMAVLRMLRDKGFHPDVNWDIIPLVNPLGLELKTRENADGIDINRDYGATSRSGEALAHLEWLKDRHYDMALCLHEDYEGEGFYLYELHHPDSSPSFSRKIIQEVSEIIQIDSREEIDEMPAVNGLMHPPEHVRNRPDLPEALKIFFHHSPLCYTFETPSNYSILDRIEAQCRAIITASEVFLELNETAES